MDSRVSPLTVAAVVGLALCTLPSLAHAGNGLHPRTPVLWDEAPCLTVVDRSVDPVLELDYAIPFEDTEVGEDEVADSRTHQFLAFCRDKDPQTVLPNWDAWEDVVAAENITLDDEPDEVTDEQVLDLSPEWEGCWTRITADADRRPITDAMAAQPITWDTTGLEAGPWIVYGYTYEPAFNVYVRRPGLVQIVDDPAPESSPPGLAITTTEQILYKGGETTFEGCIAAAEGSTVDVYWSIAGDTTEWVPFLEGEAVAGQSFSIPFMAPEAMTGKAAMIRMDITDPQGRSFTGYMTELVMVLQQEDPEDCDEGGGAFVANPGCGDDGSGSGDEASAETDSGAASTTGDGGGETDNSTTPAASDDGGTPGCGCTASSSHHGPLGLGAMLVLLSIGRWPRRRRR